MKVAHGGVVLEGLHTAIQDKLPALDILWNTHAGYELTIYSAVDSSHFARYSRHYWGGAIDMRTWTTPDSGVQFKGEERRALHYRVVNEMGENFQVLDEGDHFHIGFKPKNFTWREMNDDEQITIAGSGYGWDK